LEGFAYHFHEHVLKCESWEWHCGKLAKLSQYLFVGASTSTERWYGDGSKTLSATKKGPIATSPKLMWRPSWIVVHGANTRHRWGPFFGNGYLKDPVISLKSGTIIKVLWVYPFVVREYSYACSNHRLFHSTFKCPCITSITSSISIQNETDSRQNYYIYLKMSSSQACISMILQHVKIDLGELMKENSYMIFWLPIIPCKDIKKESGISL
jgi:hypothetical protein